MNDALPSLRECVKSVPELVELVKSAADDLGVDLDQKYTAEDNAKFEVAPVERSPKYSLVSDHSSAFKSVVEKIQEEQTQAPIMRKTTGLESEETQETEDAWLQKTRMQLMQLYQTRSQLMDELDTIADDIGVHLDESRRSSTYIDPIERAFSKVFTGISRKPTRFRNKSDGSGLEEVSRMMDQEMNQRRLNKALRRISPRSRRMSTVSQGVLGVEATLSEEMQAWLECAQTELPAAIDSIAAVMETLPAVDFALGLETGGVERADEGEEHEGCEDTEERLYQMEYAGVLAKQRHTNYVAETEEQPQHSPSVHEDKNVEHDEEQPESRMSVALKLSTDEVKSDVQLEEQSDSAVGVMAGLATLEPELQENDFHHPDVSKVTTRRSTGEILGPEPQTVEDDFQAVIVRKATTWRSTERNLSPEFELEVKNLQNPVVHEMTTTRPTEGFPTPGSEIEDNDSQPPVIRKATTRRPTDQIASEYEEDSTPQLEISSISRQGTDDQPPTGLVQRTVGPLSEAYQSHSPSLQSPIIDESLAALDIYQSSPALSIPDSPREPSRGLTWKGKIRSRCHSTAQDVLHDEKISVPYNPPGVSSKHPSTSALVPSPTVLANEAELVPNKNLAAPTTHIAERPTLSAGGSPDQESSSLNRPSNTDLSRDPQPLALPSERVAIAAFEKRRSTIPRLLAVPTEKQRKPSSAAPGIFAPPTQFAPKQMLPAGRKRKARKSVYGVNLLPDQQRPAAPEYPVRDTPTWTKPNTQTPPPKPKEQPAAKPKGGFLKFGSKPKAEPQPVSPVQCECPLEPSAQRDRGSVRPFRSAAPGHVPVYPGGTLQRPRDYETAPARQPIFLARKAATPVAVYFSPPQEVPAFARKDEYYPKLPPPLPVRRDTYPRPRATPVRRNVYSQLLPAPARKDDYPRAPPAPARRNHSQPLSPPAWHYFCEPCPAAPAGRDRKSRPTPALYKPPPRQDYPLRNKVSVRTFCSQASEPVCYQPQVQQGLRNQEKAAPEYGAPLPSRRTPTDQQPTRPPSVSQAAAKSGPVRRGARCDLQKKIPPQHGRTRNRTSTMWDQKVFSTQSGDIGRQPTSTRASHDTGRRASQIPDNSTQRGQKRCSKERRRSSAARESQMWQEYFGSVAAGPGPREDDGDLGCKYITDGTSDESTRPSINKAHTERIVRARTSLPRASTFSALDAARKISAAGSALKLSPDGTLLKPLSPIEAARTISAAGHRIKRYSIPNSEDFRSRSTTPRAGTSRSGTLRPESRRGSVMLTAEKLPRDSTGGNSSTPEEDASGARKASDRRPSTAHGRRSPRDTRTMQRADSRRANAATHDFSISFGGSTHAASEPGSPVSRASSTTITPKSFSRDRGLEQVTQSIQKVPETAAEASRAQNEPGGRGPRLGYAQLQSASSVPAPIQQYRGSRMLSRAVLRADVPCSRSPVTDSKSPVSEPASSDDPQSRSSSQQRAGSRRRDFFLAASSPPEVSSSTGHKSFCGRKDKSNSPKQNRKDAGKEGEERGDAREGAADGTQQTGQKGGWWEKKRVGAKVGGGQGVNLGFRKRLFGKWA